MVEDPPAAELRAKDGEVQKREVVKKGISLIFEAFYWSVEYCFNNTTINTRFISTISIRNTIVKFGKDEIGQQDYLIRKT